jgi:M6 family metalloprotease-like protein
MRKAFRAAITCALLVSVFDAPAVADPPPDGASGLGKKVLVIPIMHQDPPCPMDPDPTGPCQWVAAGFPATPRHSAAAYETILNTQVNDYYLKATHGHTSFQFEVVDSQSGNGWFIAPHNINEYITSGSNTVGVSLGQDAMALADQQYNLSEWSRIVVLHNFPRRGGFVSSIDYNNQSWPIVFMLEGANDAELVGLMSHELGHTLGLPDLYGLIGINCGATAGCPAPGNLGPWGMMAEDQAFTQFSGYSKVESGWIPKLSPNVRDFQLDQLLPFSNNYTLRNLAEPGENLLRLDFYTVTPLFYGYYVECRTAKPGFGDENIPEEGVLVTLVDEGWPSFSLCQRPVSAYATSNAPNDICDAALQPGESFFSSRLAGVTVTNTGMNQDECTVQVSWSGGGSSFDPAIFGAQQFDSPDIWIDSPVNGWGVYGPGNQGLDVDNAPIGPGDPLWSGQTHRIYYRVRNLGTSSAQNVTVEVGVSQPITVGLFCARPNPAQIVGSKTYSVIPPSSQSGPIVDYIEWTPLSPQPARFEVHVLSTPGEITQANNSARDSVKFYFPDCEDPNNCIGEAFGPSVVVENDCPKIGRIRALPKLVADELPIGWDVLVNPLESLILPGATVDFQIELTPPVSPIGGGEPSQSRGVTGSFFTVPVEFQQTFGDSLTGEGGHLFEYADGINLMSFFLPAGTINCSAVPDVLEVGQTVDVVGIVMPQVSSSPVALEYLAPSGQSSLRLVQTDASAGYTDRFVPNEAGDWTVQALWAAEDSHRGAQSLPCAFTAELGCVPPFEVSIDTVSISADGSGSPVLNIDDPNPFGQASGYNVFRSATAGSAQSDWEQLATDVGDEDATTPGIQWTDRTGDVSATGVWYYEVAAYNAPCGGQGPW